MDGIVADSLDLSLQNYFVNVDYESFAICHFEHWEQSQMKHFSILYIFIEEYIHLKSFSF